MPMTEETQERHVQDFCNIAESMKADPSYQDTVRSFLQPLSTNFASTNGTIFNLSTDREAQPIESHLPRGYRAWRVPAAELEPRLGAISLQSALDNGLKPQLHGSRQLTTGADRGLQKVQDICIVTQKIGNQEILVGWNPGDTPLFELDPENTLVLN